MARQLQDLKAQRAAAHSRNLALEKLLELQGLQPTNGVGHDESITSDAGDAAPASNNRQTTTSCQSKPMAHSICTPIQLSVNVDALARTCAHGRQAPVLRFTANQLEELEFADFAKLWKEYISRCAVKLLFCMLQPSHGSAVASRATVFDGPGHCALNKDKMIASSFYNLRCLLHTTHGANNSCQLLC